MHIVIVPNIKGTPLGKLADAEVHFTTGILSGAKLVGFGIWESRWPGGGIRVTVPSREYTKDGEAKRYDLLRPVDRDHDQPAIDALRDAILEAFTESESGGIEQATAIAREVGRTAQARTPQAQRPAPPARPVATPVRHQAPARPRIETELPPVRRGALPAVGAPPVRQQVPMRRAAGQRPDIDDDSMPF